MTRKHYDPNDWKYEGKPGFARHTPCGENVPNSVRRHHQCHSTVSHHEASPEGSGSYHQQEVTKRMLKIKAFLDQGINTNEIAKRLHVNPGTVSAYKRVLRGKPTYHKGPRVSALVIAARELNGGSPRTTSNLTTLSSSFSIRPRKPNDVPTSRQPLLTQFDDLRNTLHERLGELEQQVSELKLIIIGPS